MTRDSGSKPDRATTTEIGVVHESHGAGTAIAQEVSGMTIIGEEMLDPCRKCGAPCRVEHFHATPHRSDQNLWICSQHQMFGGKCPSDIAYLFEDAWNTRSPEAVTVTEEMIEAGARTVEWDYKRGYIRDCDLIAIYEAMRDAALLKVTLP